ncbi:hypothetical protein RYO59_000269 [Thermosynechococcaceae cyanobacterium Okahandja]
MAWDTDLTPIFNHEFRGLRNRLLLSYFLVTSAILGVFATAIYFLVYHDRNQQLDTHLRHVAASASRTFEIIQHEYGELTTDNKYKGYVSLEVDGTPPPITLSQLMGKYRVKSALEATASSLTASHQRLEWYDVWQRLMIYEGRLFLETTLPKDIPQNGIFIQKGNIRSFTQPVFSSSTTNETRIIGYVRVAESTFPLEMELHQLRWSLIIGVFIVSVLTGVGGIWLTHESLKPVVQSFNQLRQFTSDASHELRNPLTAIRASIAVMQTHPERVHPADWEKLTSIATASAQMSRLVDDLLLLARMDWQAPNRVGWRNIPLDELLEDLLSLYSDQAMQSQISLKSQLVSNLEVNGDAS